MFAHCVPFPAPGPPRTKTTVGVLLLAAAAVVLDAVPPMMRRRLRRSRDGPLSMHHTGTRKPPQKKNKNRNNDVRVVRSKRGSFFLSLSLSKSVPARSTISLSLSLSPMNYEMMMSSFQKGETIQNKEDFVFRVLLYLGF